MTVTVSSEHTAGHIWTIDQTITVLALPEGAKVYEEEAVAKTSWSTEFPCPLTVDPAEVFEPVTR
jgi:hypothetical protein